MTYRNITEQHVEKAKSYLNNALSELYAALDPNGYLGEYSEDYQEKLFETVKILMDLKKEL